MLHDPIISSTLCLVCTCILRSQVSLEQLLKAIKGFVVMSEELEKIYTAFLNNQVCITNNRSWGVACLSAYTVELYGRWEVLPCLGRLLLGYLTSWGCWGVERFCPSLVFTELEKGENVRPVLPCKVILWRWISGSIVKYYYDRNVYFYGDRISDRT